MNCWLVLSYDLCRVIEADETTYRLPTLDEGPLEAELKGDMKRTAVTYLVGTEHARMRRLYLRLLNQQAMPQYREDHVRPIINDAIDRFLDRGSAELITQFSDLVPARIMASLFGLPWKNDALIANVSQWHKDLLAWMYDRNNEELTQKAKCVSYELNKLFLPLVLERREKRGNDFISQIWSRAPEDWGEVDADDVMGIVRDIELGAGITTTNAIANAIYLFLSDSAVREAVTKDQEYALNALVEESLRLLGALQWRFRKANRDVSLAGATVKKDDPICLLHAAANRDPEHYACPHLVDLNRKPPTDHMAFSSGPRICPGMHLARLQMRECLKVLINRLPDLRLDPEKEAPRLRGFSHRSYGPLHVLF
ncbi:cytochrome P450 [Bradyrhizobium diazoefficiens]|uniref:cytochrome P450 n=1 Tax=Bradyrhizobium diazoefficiens TaxID=1355477 RepID=UPI00190B0C9F|nr:cytochrome P450 [Bradyrhizobium diazoefficiens]QQO35551.1 cytochrome P450 [Bradyrhizobium diazoefficiens]